MYYAGLFINLFIIFYGSWYHYYLCNTNRSKYNAKIFMLIARLFHDYLMTNRLIAIGKPLTI